MEGLTVGLPSKQAVLQRCRRLQCKIGITRLSRKSVASLKLTGTVDEKGMRVMAVVSHGLRSMFAVVLLRLLHDSGRGCWKEGGRGGGGISPKQGFIRPPPPMRVGMVGSVVCALPL